MKPRLTDVAKYCFIVFLFNCFITANAQTKEIHLTKFYLQGAAGASTRSGGHTELSLQGVVRNKWSFTLSCHYLNMKPNNLPADYQPETGFIFGIPTTSTITVDMKLYSLTAGKFLPLGRNTWLNTEAGVSVVNGQKVSFEKQERQDYAFFFVSGTTSNYNSTIEKKTAVGGMLRADFNWAFCRFMGLGAGVFANFNSIQSAMGYNLKLTVGAMGRHRKLKPGK